MMNMPNPEKNMTAFLEALLFVHGEAIKIKKAAEILGVKEKEVIEAADELEEGLNSSSRGLSLLREGDKLQLVTTPEAGELIKDVAKYELDTKLTSASLETLAIIGYLGPCSRAIIEYIRGVNCSFILRSLSIRGLIDRVSDLERANNYLYKLSFDFLKHMGVSSQEELPEYEKYKDLVKDFMEDNNEHEDNNN